MEKSLEDRIKSFVSSIVFYDSESNANIIPLEIERHEFMVSIDISNNLPTKILVTIEDSITDKILEVYCYLESCQTSSHYSALIVKYRFVTQRI